MPWVYSTWATATPTVDFSSYFGKLGIGSLSYARDLWRQKDISTSDTRYFIPSHGVKFIRIKY